MSKETVRCTCEWTPEGPTSRREDPKYPAHNPELWPRLKDRIKELDLLQGDTILGPDDKVTYTWRHGYETLEVEPTDHHGGSRYGGSFHPRGGLCIGNPCDYCGAVSFE